MTNNNPHSTEQTKQSNGSHVYDSQSERKISKVAGIIVTIVAILILSIWLCSYFNPEKTSVISYGLGIGGIASGLYILSRQFVDLEYNPLMSQVTFDKQSGVNITDKCTISLHSDSGITDRLARQQIIVVPEGSNPLTWKDTPAHITEGEKIEFIFEYPTYLDPEEAASHRIFFNVQYGPFNAEITTIPQTFEIYDAHTMTKIDEYQI